MDSNGLILSIYPAPYRVKLFEEIAKTINLEVYFEHSCGDDRKTDWFAQGNYYLIDTTFGKEKYKQAIKNIRDYDFVALYDYSTNESIKLIMLCKKFNIPYIINSDGVMLTKHGNPIKTIIKRYLIRGAKACLASGDNAKEYFIRHGAKNDTIYIHTFSTLSCDDISTNKLSVQDKKELRTKLCLPSDAKIAIAVGRFISLKRYKELIFAWRNMPQNLILLLIGSGKEEQCYRHMITKYNINNVIIKGFYPKDELFEFYKASDIFVHPTSYDVWGLVVNEAMANGLPVVVSDHCIAGLELVKNGKNGYIIPMGNDDELCNRVIEICSDENMCTLMSISALETIKPYTMEHMAQTHIRVIKEMLINESCFDKC